MVESFATWLQTTSPSLFVLEQKFWVWPVAETLHFMGLAFLVGMIGVFDLRMLGMAKKLPLAPFYRLLPWGIGGVGLSLITGMVFFVGDPVRYIHNGAFALKVLLLLLAGINVLVFYLTVSRETEALEAGDDAPLGAKIIAAVSLCLWAGVLLLGRWITIYDDTFLR